MNRNCLIYLALAMTLSAFAFGGTAWAEFTLVDGKVAGDLALNAAIQQQDVNGSKEKFAEYREVEDSFILNDFRIKLNSTTTPCYLDLKIKDALQDDESYRLVIGQYGRYKATFDYDSTPHNFGSGSFLWGGFGKDRLQIADVVQSQLEANEQTGVERSGGVLDKSTDPNTDFTGEDAIQQGIVNGLYAAADSADFSITRETTGASFEINLNQDVKAWLRVKNENRDGARVINAGTYERWNVGSGLGHTIDRFIPSGAEIAEPIDFQTLWFTTGVGVYKKNWLLDAEYTFTEFNNSNEALLWDNPFRISDAIQSSGVDRGRFEVGQLALVPDSEAHDLSVSGALDLPLHSKLAASLSYGVITQDQSFVPYSQSTAISGPAGFDVTDPTNLPQSNLDGEVETLAMSLSLSSRPIEPVSVNLKYRYYDYDGKSDEIHFPGYAAFGESDWRTVKNDKNAPVVNEVFDYTRQNLDLGVDFRVAKPLTLSLEGGWEGWHFDNLRIDDLEEFSVGAGALYRFGHTSRLKFAYKYSDRSMGDYLQGRTAENPEATGLINFNWADRERKEVSVRFQTMPVETVTFGVAGSWRDEEYDGKTEGGTVADEFRFGRTDVESWFGGVDVTFTPNERVSLFANYSHENREEQMANAAKDDGGAAGTNKAFPDLGVVDQYAPVNYWDTDIEEDVDTFGIGATLQLIPGKLVLDANYNYSYSDMDLSTTNPNGISGTTLANAVANDWDSVRSELHEFKVDLSYQFTENIKAGLLYLYERYDLDDFAWDNTQPYMAGMSVENTTKYVFTDGNYDGYTAHVGGLYLNASF